MSEPLVLSVQVGAVRTLTLNRPKALNSFTADMHEALAQALSEAETDAQVRCLVLTGAGRAFCAGQDLADPAVAPNLAPGARPTDVGNVIERYYKPLVLRLRAMPVPVIAAVNGVCAGAGASLALGCDIVIAARSASFIQAFSKIGLVPDAGGTWLLPRLVGRANALALAMTGDKLTAEAAQQMGLIWKCVDDAAFVDDVSATAARLAAMPVKALVATRAVIDASMQLGLADALSLEGEWQSRLSASRDYLEGVAAFMAKRPAHFSDR
ncbi:MAG: 2-(1,2-epoxy-1,2-dihydrophenyl)acetyl-CoA isomerase [Burkholderiales bacterium]|nr:2-(1,2-epoxy-1,2-dihydrophenyl)acetyl-CoA isomerase [Burkholderiales bacterium]